MAAACPSASDSIRRKCTVASIACIALIFSVSTQEAHGAAGALDPDAWVKLALAPCVTAAERQRVSDDVLAVELGRPSQSKEQAAFLQRELKARRGAAGRQRTAALARLEFLLLGSKIKITDLEKKGTGPSETARALLDLLFHGVDACALEALETTTISATFAIPFDSASAGELGPFREFQAVDTAMRERLRSGQSLPEIFSAMRPTDRSLTFQYVDAVARAAVEGSPSGERDNTTEHRLQQLLELTRLAAEPLRIQIYLQARIDEVEGALGTPVSEAAARRLMDRAETSLFRNLQAMKRLQAQPPADTLRALTPVVDRWFRSDALDSVRHSLSGDPFAAYWFFVESGATVESGPVFAGSPVAVQPSLVLRSLEHLTLADALGRIRESRIPERFLEYHAELEKAFTDVALPAEEARTRIDRSAANPGARAKLRQFVADAAGSDFSALDVYTVVVRDASKIRGRVDWPTLGLALDLLHEAKSDRVDQAIQRILAAEPQADPRLGAYLRTAGGLMLELERRQLKERRFQQRTSGAIVGWLLSQFMISGGVPVELWAPGGVQGGEFAGLVDRLTPKNSASGNQYHAKEAERVRLVHNGREYHDALVEVIDTARDFINITAFDWKTDSGGRDIAYRLMAKKLDISGGRYTRFFETFADGLPLDSRSSPPVPFYDIPTTRMKDLLVWFFFQESGDPAVVAAREAVRAAGASLACDTVMICGDLRGLFEQVGERYDPGGAPGPTRAWHAYQQLESLFADRPSDLSDVRRRRALREYIEDPDALRRLISRYGKRRTDRDEPLPINVVADAKQTFFNVHLGERSGYFPHLFSDPIRDIYFPLLEFDVHLVIWKGPLEFPWRVGAVPIPGRKIFRVLPMPFVPYAWLNAVPGFGALGAASSVFLQYLLASDPRTYWGMVSHTKSWSNESMALESGMGMGSKYFNLHEEYKTWHDMGAAVYGPPAEDVNDHFVQVFNQARVNNGGIPSSRGVAARKLRYEDYRPRQPAAATGGSQSTWLLTTHPEQGDSNYRGVFLAALAAARTNIFIENSFFSDPLVARMLMRKAREFRGRVSCTGLNEMQCSERRRDAVRIHLVLPDASDKPIVDAVGTADFHEMLHLGIKIHRWGPSSGWSASRMLHTKAWLIDYEPDRGGLAYVGAANATQRSHLSDNEAGILTRSPEFAREVYERLFEPDIKVDSRLEGVEGFHIVWSSNPVVRGSRWLRRLLVDLLWFI
jgi:phosphatidylserine/phosphatidylglycerophosphate/cardiolipin synthase-like enzyme